MRSNNDLFYTLPEVDNVLCHYTTFEALCSVLSTMTLRVGTFKNANDIAELEADLACLLNPNKCKEVESFIRDHCGYISFSTNKMDDKSDTIDKLGCLIPSMWGIYAEKSKGACLLIDKEVLLKENMALLARAKWHDFVKVNYMAGRNLQLIKEDSSVEKYIIANNKELLGTKHESWSHEQEERFVGIDLPSTLSLKNGVVRYIVLGTKMTELQKERLNTILHDPNMSCFNQIDNSQLILYEIMGKEAYLTRCCQFKKT